MMWYTTEKNYAFLFRGLEDDYTAEEILEFLRDCTEVKGKKVVEMITTRLLFLLS